MGVTFQGDNGRDTVSGVVLIIVQYTVSKYSKRDGIPVSDIDGVKDDIGVSDRSK